VEGPNWKALGSGRRGRGWKARGLERIWHGTSCIDKEEAVPVSQGSRKCYSSLCNRLVIVVNGLNELVQTLLSPGPNTTGVLKV
jgi:hypothetical protein